MAITNYTQLKTAIASWLHRSGDSELEAAIPDFISLAEVRFNRLLRTRAMYGSFASVALVDGVTDLPDDFKSFVELRYDDPCGWTLEPRSLEWIRTQGAVSSAPQFFAVTASQLVCYPTSGNVVGTYYQTIPALSDGVTTNWLLTAYPDLYLFASLVESVLWTQDDSRLAIWADKTAALMDQVQGEDEKNAFGGGPLAVRLR